MNIYIQNRGSYGVSIVFATSESEARHVIDREIGFDPSWEIEEYPVGSGFSYHANGDGVEIVKNGQEDYYNG